MFYKKSVSLLNVTEDKDPTNLGRWSSITLHKPGERKLKIINAYQLVKNQKIKELTQFMLNNADTFFREKILYVLI